MNDTTGQAIRVGDYAEILEGSWAGRTCKVTSVSQHSSDYVWVRFTDIDRYSPFNEKFGLYKVKACTMSRLV